MTVKVLAITSDLFLQSRIIELTKSLGSTSTIVTSENELMREMKNSIPRLVILDLAASEYDPFSCAERLRALSTPPIILAMYSHVRTELMMRGREVGIDYIVPNSSFLKTLRTILEKEVVSN